MLITISFYEAANHTSENPENFIPPCYTPLSNERIEKIDNVGKELNEILNECYFGGANGSEYKGFNINNEVFEFKLIPN